MDKTTRILYIGSALSVLLGVGGLISSLVGIALVWQGVHSVVVPVVAALCTLGSVLSLLGMFGSALWTLKRGRAISS